MATYYVRPDGNNGNTGLGSGVGQAWATISKALGATGITSGDTLYIAPGTYREAVTVGGTYSSATYVYGNPTASFFSGISAGEVRITPSGSDNLVSTSYAITATSKNNLNFRDLVIGGMVLTTCSNTVLERCYLHSTSATTEAFYFIQTNYTNYNTTIKQCIIVGSVYGIRYTYIFGSSPYTTGFYVSDSFIIANTSIFLDNQLTFSSNGPSGFNFYNCVIIGSTTFQMTYGSHTGGGSVTNSGIFNSLMYATGSYVFNGGPGIIENYNRIYGVNTRVSVTQGANTTVASWPGLEFGQSLLQGYGPIQIFGNTYNSPNAIAGTATSAPIVDMYGQPWNASPDIGLAIYRNIGSVGSYQPSSQVSGTLSIAPGSTSQSIELYLGITGLTYNTSGLTAYYIRNKSTTTSISLVSQTASGSWVSGGFAEISSTNAPGLYRLDIPNAALATGADEVTIIFRGSSATNGAVITINLRNKAQLDPTQVIGTTTVGDALNSANVGGVGRWSISGDLLYLYAADGSLTKKLRVKNLRIDV